VYEAVFALLEGRPMPDPAAEGENRLQILRGITNKAAAAAYDALVPLIGTRQPAAVVDGTDAAVALPT
jgi:hypothetical protein